MRVGIVQSGNVPAVLLQDGSDRIDFSRAYQAYRLVVEGIAAEPVRSIAELLHAGAMTVDRCSKVLAFLGKHGLKERYRVAEPDRYLLPLRPGKLVCLGRNYAAHAAETGAKVPEEPVIFSKSPGSCIGDGEPIITRESYGRVDHEAELAFVIGRKALHVDEEEAADYIAGYTILNDVTARGMQQADIGQGLPWFRSKSIDTFGPMGPVIALPDEIPWPVEVDIELRVNGAIRQQSNTSKFLFPIPNVLSYITRFMTLEPGDVVATGTPEGISAVAPGDLIEITIPQIGVLRNPVAPSRARTVS